MARPCTVAYLGPPASFTHEAARKFANTIKSSHSASSKDPDVISSPSIAAVFTAIQNKSATYGIVPIENSSNGSVVFTLDLFVDKAQNHPSIYVVGDVYIPVKHCLLGRQNPNSTDLSHITTLRTHPQAWSQCTRFLDANVPGAKRFDASSTSEAAAIIAADQTDMGQVTASISNKLAAEVYGLDVLAEGIEDSQENTTRFLVIANESERSLLGSNSLSAATDGEVYKTLLSFSVGHEDPGALAKALAVFGTHGLNLTSINARPSGEVNWHYVFLVEFLGERWFPGQDGESATSNGKKEGALIGRQPQDVSGGEEVARALRELGSVVKEWKWLGCWKSEI